MITIGSYLTAYVLSLIVNLVSALLVVVVNPLTQRFPGVAIVGNLLAAFAGGLGAVWLYTILAEHTPLELTYGMLLLPALAGLWNDQGRIARAKAGMSGVRATMEAWGDLESYDATIDVRSEQAAQLGRVIGYLTGLALFVGGAPLLW